jgi:diaminopimelate epimerase
MKIEFTKMNGCGNDFMIIDLRNFTFDLNSEIVKKLADYKKSVGFDQLITIHQSSIADASINIFNCDGSMAEACGNGTRCVAKLIIEQLGKKKITISTINRILEAKELGNSISINMGEAKMVQEYIQLDCISASLVEIGNPHIVINNLQNLDILIYGPLIENNHLFPNKVNVNFAQIVTKEFVSLRTWERGAGATLSCGTGACATFYALYKMGLINNKAVISQLGGNLEISLNGKEIIMSGDANFSYQGSLIL